MDDNPFAIFQIFDGGKGTGQTVCVGDMRGEDRVAVLGGEGAAVQPACDAVEPAETQGFLHRVVVLDTRLACRFFVVDRPNIFFGLVIFLQPVPPIFAVRDVERLGYFHVFCF